MIKVQKAGEPDVLKHNKNKWTGNLISLVKKYGSYDAIPGAEKEAAIKPYTDPSISSALKGAHSNAKCVYCESYVDVTGYANIEHFHPKSLYPDETFAWDNLFVGCTLCNTPKGNFDTNKEPFIHPVWDNPEDYLTFDDLQYVPKYNCGIARLKAENVIERCDLRRIPLIRQHGELLLAFLKTRQTLAWKIEQYDSRKQNAKRVKDAMDILCAMVELDKEASDGAQYAGFMRYMLRKYNEIRKAVVIINMHREALGLSDEFHWSFVF